MRRLARAILLALVFFSLASPLPASAQDYSFTLDQETVDVYWEADGTARIDYMLVFTNDAFAPPMDYIDVGVPTSSYSLSDVTGASTRTITDIALAVRRSGDRLRPRHRFDPAGQPRRRARLDPGGGGRPV
jgi:hypothetical protein